MSEDLEKRKNDAVKVGDLVGEFLSRMQITVDDDPVDEVARALAEKEEREQVRLRLLLARGVPKKAARLVATNTLDPTPFLARVREFMAGSPGTLVLSGGVGCGKTVAASWAVAQPPADPYQGAESGMKRWPVEYYPMFVTIAELLRRPVYGDASTVAFEPLENCCLLVIDDLGNEVADPKGKTGEIVEALLVKRHDNDLRTICTTNHDSRHFIERYGERVRDRVRGAGAFFALDAPSLR